MVRITSSDSQEFSVPQDIAFQSQLIKNMIEDIGDADEQPIPLPNVAGAILQKVIEYATMHKDDPPSAPETETKLSSSEDIDDRDKLFLNVDQGTLFEIILAANYLDMKGLLDVGCKTVANMIKGKTVEEVRALFNIVNDFTPEEEEQIRKENEWCEDR
ncbi:Skp1 family, dimerization domain-containing protein [Chytriomyces cf. hyalinus JEL632]|nr:Skp1 family, dimerization domain-containing protein [Chytriomyces cf. hyalinus JEL632]